MQLLLLSRSPCKAARRMQNRKLPSKLAIEAVQLLSTALRKHGIHDDDRLCKPTHINHPCAHWVAAGKSHMQWTIQYAKSCLKIFDKHIKKQTREHATWARIRAIEELMNVLPASVPETVSANELALICKEGTWISSSNAPEGCACAVLAIEPSMRAESVRYDEKGEVDTVATYRAFHQLKHPVEKALLSIPWFDEKSTQSA